ncbi:MAG: tRNA pseudouridine(38-40) synthase TruA [Alphaproteobacteria bacterium]|nr:tRNA pseudouridine(38-40) synthase TruA [Alphaproteobacteria bacterium]
MRYRLTIEYDGTPFVGWQRQQAPDSVQQVLEEALAVALRHPVVLFGSGRTDAGVHAWGQVAHFDTDAVLDGERLRESVNALVRPHPIVIRSAEPVPDTFHARTSARQRTYVYVIQNTPHPPALDRDRVWHVRAPLDAAQMQRAGDMLIGKHDFSTFRAAAFQAKSPVKTLDELRVEREGDRILITARARSFMHHQVRNIVGSLVSVGSGRWTIADFEDAFRACDRKRGGETAPARGLYFIGVRY